MCVYFVQFWMSRSHLMLRAILCVFIYRAAWVHLRWVGALSSYILAAPFFRQRMGYVPRHIIRHHFARGHQLRAAVVVKLIRDIYRRNFIGNYYLCRDCAKCPPSQRVRVLVNMTWVKMGLVAGLMRRIIEDDWCVFFLQRYKGRKFGCFWWFNLCYLSSEFPSLPSKQ